MNSVNRSAATCTLICGLCLLLCPVASRAEEPNSREEFFEVKIRPVLAAACIECHGPKKASGGLRLDSREALAQGGESGMTIEPGDVEASLLLHAIAWDESADLKMPPEKPLPRETVADFRRWIADGAWWPESQSTPIPSAKGHWAFEPLLQVELPPIRSNWATRPIDRFIDSARRSQNLSPVKQASKRSLIRRAYFDLIGLPPTEQQIERYLVDDSAEAFAKVVDELLASERYGERWGRQWLDLVRYADTAGDNADYPIPQAHLYRDYVIDCFNADVPYDRFLHEQLAGDILAQTAPESDYARLVTATGLIAQAKRIGTRELEDMHLIIEDTLATIGPALLGLSLRCARCHDHKYDPLTTQDYYALYGFFASTQYPFAGAEEVRRQTKFAPLLPSAKVKELLSPRESKLASMKSELEALKSSSSVSQRIAQLDGQRTNIEKQLNELNTEKTQSETTQSVDQQELKSKLERIQTELTAAKKELEELTKPLQDELTNLERDLYAGIPTAYAVGELPPVDVAIQVGGNPRTSQGEPVPRGVPKVLDAEPLELPSGSSGRLELARWLTERASFLTARVMVNRVWQGHFGKPLVPTPSDFGYRGTPPTHPELLDWLAGTFIESGWSLKSLHRTIMLSNTYQLSSEDDINNLEVDEGNTWYWKFDRRRLDAEALRDSVMWLSGSLNLSRPGPHPFPEPSKWRYTAHHQFNDVCYPSDHRSVYLMVQRLHAHPYLSLFNGPDPSLSTPSRDASTVPLQALYLLNNEFMHLSAANVARHAVAETEDGSERLRLMYLRFYGRPPTDHETELCKLYLTRYDQSLEQESLPEEHRELETWSSLARTMFASNQFFYVD